MTTNEHEASSLGGGIAAAQPVPGNQNPGEVYDGVSTIPDEPQAPVSRSYIFWLMLASFGASIAMMVPLSYGIAVRIAELDPGHEEVLGYITGSAQVIYLLISPIVGLPSPESGEVPSSSQRSSRNSTGGR